VLAVSEVNFNENKLAYVAIAVAALILARSLFIGVWIRDDVVIGRSWFRTYTWPRGDVISVHSVAYQGMLNWGGLGGSSGLRTLAVGVNSAGRSRLVVLRGTLAFYGSIKRQAHRAQILLEATNPAGNHSK
jgi:hypothetical protein